MKKKIFQNILGSVKYIWLIINVFLFVMCFYALINSYVSHKYEVEGLREPISQAAKIRTDWITEQIAESRLFTIVFGINTLFILGTIWKLRKKTKAINNEQITDS